MILLFAKFIVERVEVALLSTVDQKADEQLIGRFRQYGAAHDPHMASIQRASEQLLSTVENSCRQQTDLLSDSLKVTNEKWASLADSTAETISTTLANGLSRGLKTHAVGLNEGVGRFAEQLEQTLIRHAEISMKPRATLHCDERRDSPARGRFEFWNAQIDRGYGARSCAVRDSSGGVL